jgi:hypothetical protein
VAVGDVVQKGGCLLDPFLIYIGRMSVNGYVSPTDGIPAVVVSVMRVGECRGSFVVFVEI